MISSSHSNYKFDNIILLINNSSKGVRGYGFLKNKEKNTKLILYNINIVQDCTYLQT